MNKLVLGLCVLAAQFTVVAQQADNAEDVSIRHQKPTAPAAHDSQKAIPFWTEDFGGGIPTSWDVIDSSGICPWVHSFDGSWGYFNGNTATAGGEAINSTTATNGFMICDVDSANHFTYGQPSGSNYQYLSSYFITSSIDCSGHSSVILSFEQFFRYNNSVSLNVLVSNDSTNWTAYDVAYGYANNTFSPNQDIVDLNITNIAANQSTVYIKIGWSARVYFWMIDDISLSEAEANDVALGNNWWGTGLTQSQYYKIPLVQASPVTFYSEISNNTGASITDIFSDVTVTNTGGVDFQGTSAQATLLPVEMDTFALTTNWTPATQGLHTVDYLADVNGVTDGDLTNNDFTDELEITSTIYGLDNLQTPADATGSISNFSSNTGQPFKIGNVYEIINDAGIQC
ncbi:MAG: hypothetical protein JKY09_05360, partial [Crocinitomicaceae bacterium]|nr:hypothetical protein [Crocinitomicaceae bacterium]